MRIHKADGSPALAATVAAWPIQATNSTPKPQHLDERGGVQLRCLPGAAILRVYVGGQIVVERPITIASGTNAEVVVDLPR